MRFLWLGVISLCSLHSVLTSNADNLNNNMKLQSDQILNYAKVEPPNPSVGLLYPRESETREVHSLDGVWSLIRSNISDPLQGVREKWYKQNLRATNHEMISVPVPASYNDLTVDQRLRDHVGTVWYERHFYVPKRWMDDGTITMLRFGSIHYSCVVWINGFTVLRHSFGHLPFEVEVGSFVQYGKENRITIMVDNRLNNHTIPQGRVEKQVDDFGYTYIQTYTFDFFNYAGIHRSVQLYTTPSIHIRDVELKTQVMNQGMGRIDYRLWIVDAGHPMSWNTVQVKLRDRNGILVTSQVNRSYSNGTLLIPNVKPWWPYLMHPEPGYMYTLEFHLMADNQLLDVYRMPVGVRSLSWNSGGLYINSAPVYLRGFGKHEDSDIRGKGLDFALLTRDFSLLQWIGANAYRTSHYPYSEESMQFADAHGIMIIDECASVNTDLFEPALLQNHMSYLEQLIHRDRNHASVIAWSIANEPRTKKKAAEAYFGALTNYTRSIAQGRPLTAASNIDKPADCMMSQFLDIIGFNRYNSWYHNAGRTDMIVKPMIDEAIAWRNRYQKPVILFEYGADALEGYHTLPTFIWSEEYQTTLLSKHFEAFDKLRKLQWFIGEFVWNFADFKTEQTFTRVGGNKKGVFTRNRQPKDAAHLLRQRYYVLALTISNASLPADLFYYIIDWN